MLAGDISIREAAPLCGLNYGSWTGWERGSMPRDLLRVVDKIAAALDIDREWLLFGGPLSEAEENRDRWRPHQAGSDTGEYHRTPILRSVRHRRTRSGDVLLTNRTLLPAPVAA
jgi:hypothetical protein